MAERLKEYTRINPLTINQVSYSEKGKSQFNDPILKAMNITESSVLLDSYSNPFKYQGFLLIYEVQQIFNFVY